MCPLIPLNKDPAHALIPGSDQQGFAAVLWLDFPVGVRQLAGNGGRWFVPKDTGPSRSRAVSRA